MKKLLPVIFALLAFSCSESRNQKLLDQNSRLRKVNQDQAGEIQAINARAGNLTRSLETLRKDVIKKDGETVELREKIRALKIQIRELEKENRNLTARLKVLKKSSVSRNTE